MIGIRHLRWAASCFLASGWAAAADINIVFNITDSVRNQTISYSTGNTSRQEIRHTGTMDAVLTFDPAEQRPTAIRFTDGRVYRSPHSFSNTAKVSFFGGPARDFAIVQSATSILMRTYTEGAPNPIDSGGWILDTDRLRSFPLEGVLTTRITIDGQTQSRTINVATNPPDSVEAPTGLQIYLDLGALTKGGTTTDYKLTYIASMNGLESSDMPNTDTTVTNRMVETTIAEAFFSSPNPYGQWLLDNGYRLEDERATNKEGLSLAVLFAFNRPANDTRSLPWRFGIDSGTPVLTLQLPNGGLKQAIRVEYCDDLGTGAWEPVSADDFIDTGRNLDQGDTGTRRIRFSGSTSRFYRVVPASP